MFLFFSFFILRKLTFKFGQNQVSNRGYVADVFIVGVIVVIVVVVVVDDVVHVFVVIVVVDPRNQSLKFG